MKPEKSRKTTRRKFLKGMAAAAIVPATFPSIGHGYPANSRVRHAGIGIRGMGGHDLKMIASHSMVDVAFLCDIDDTHIADAAKTHTKAKHYNDFRRLFDKESKNIDSCHVTVPDHMHAPIAMTAVLNGKHTYCQKPLTHELDEARKLTIAARKAGVVTQIGTQIHSHAFYRTCVRLIQSGTIGKVREVHTWADRNWSNNGRPTPVTPPPHVHWDLWLGVAPERPYGPNVYHPKEWWSWMDFGTGNLGDMGCHLLDPVVSSLKLRAPRSIRAHGHAPKNETWPNFGKVFYEFPGTKYSTNPVTWTWYDGGYKEGHIPEQYLAPFGPDETYPSQGSIFIGDRGVLLLPHVDAPRLLPAKDFADMKIELSDQRNHWHDFVDACMGKGQATANFVDHAGPLTETVLLGNVARRFPSQVLEWDTENMKFPNFGDANQYVGRTYRKGWEIEGLS
jgi:predicted dehydrogenase